MRVLLSSRVAVLLRVLATAGASDPRADHDIALPPVLAGLDFATVVCLFFTVRTALGVVLPAGRDGDLLAAVIGGDWVSPESSLVFSFFVVFPMSAVGALCALSGARDVRLNLVPVFDSQFYESQSRLHPLQFS